MAENNTSSDYQFKLRDSIIGAQMLFVAFGALVLVPLLTGLNANVALFTAGAGTLIFQFLIHIHYLLTYTEAYPI